MQLTPLQRNATNYGYLKLLHVGADFNHNFWYNISLQCHPFDDNIYKLQQMYGSYQQLILAVYDQTLNTRPVTILSYTRTSLYTAMIMKQTWLFVIPVFSVLPTWSWSWNYNCRDHWEHIAASIINCGARPLQCPHSQYSSFPKVIHYPRTFPTRSGAKPFWLSIQRYEIPLPTWPKSNWTRCTTWQLPHRWFISRQAGEFPPEANTLRARNAASWYPPDPSFNASVSICSSREDPLPTIAII